jgi:exonuclease V gamma subunit
MAKSEAEEQLKKLIKLRTKGKTEPICVYVKIREAKDIVDLKIKDSEDGIVELRVHSTNEHFPKWYTTGYLIDVKNLRINYKDIKKKEEIQEILLNPSKVVHKATKQLLAKFEKDYGGIIPDGKKLLWKTDKFKKRKDPYKVKMKSM